MCSIAPQIGLLIWRCFRGSAVAEERISVLLRCGFLMRHTRSQNMHYLAVPNAGTVVRSIMGGRKVCERW